MRPSPNAPQVVKPDGGGAFNRDEEKRLNREAVATARISHRNVVTIYEHWMAPSKREFCHVLERVFGPTLAEFLVAMQRVTSGVVKQQTAIGIAKAVLEGLEAIHASGIVHRDIKPDNIMLTTGRQSPDFAMPGDFLEIDDWSHHGAFNDGILYGMA